MMLEHASEWFQTPLISWGCIIWGTWPAVEIEQGISENGVI